jgi:hypothetical protein
VLPQSVVQVSRHCTRMPCPVSTHQSHTHITARTQHARTSAHTIWETNQFRAVPGRVLFRASPVACRS